MGAPRWLRRILGMRDEPARVQPGAPPGIPPGSSALAAFLEALEEIGEAHGELFDTDVRERVWEAIEGRYLALDRGFEIPAELGMFSAEGNARLCAVLDRHLDNLIAIAEAFRLDTKAKRLRTIQAPNVRTERNARAFDDFFGAP